MDTNIDHEKYGISGETIISECECVLRKYGSMIAGFDVNIRNEDGWPHMIILTISWGSIKESRVIQEIDLSLGLNEFSAKNVTPLVTDLISRIFLDKPEKPLTKDSLADYQAKTVRELRNGFPGMRFYLDAEIAQCYSQYCEMFHGASWTKVDSEDFVRWATKSPLDLINWECKAKAA